MVITQPQAPAKLKTTADVTHALLEMSWLDHTEQEQSAIVQKELDALKRRHEKLFLVTIEGEDVPISQRRKVVEALVLKWAKDHPDKILDGDKKSLELPHGTIGFRQSPLKIELLEGMTEEDVLEKLNRKTDFRQYISDMLNKIFGKHFLGMFVEFGCKLSRSKILQAFKEHRLTEKDLNAYGLAVRPAEDQPFVKPARYQVDPNQ